MPSFPFVLDLAEDGCEMSGPMGCHSPPLLAAPSEIACLPCLVAFVAEVDRSFRALKSPGEAVWSLSFAALDVALHTSSLVCLHRM